MSNILIQIQDKSGNWLTIQSLSSANDIDINLRMNETARSFPDRRVRAVDQKTYSIVNIL